MNTAVISILAVVQRRGNRIIMRGAGAACGLAVLLAVGTLIYSLATQDSGESKYGTMNMPGSTQARLPAGTVDVTFTADFSGQTVPVPVIQPDEVTARLDGGGATATFSQYNGAVNSINDVIHVQVGTLSVPKAGTYQIAVDHYSDLPAPQLDFGKVADNAPLTVGGFALAGFLLVTSISTLIVMSRVKFSTPQAFGPGMTAPGPAVSQAFAPGMTVRRVVLGDRARPLPGQPGGGLTPEQSAQAALDGGLRLGLVRADATVLAAHDVAIPPGMPGAPPGGLVDLTLDVRFPGGEPAGYATTTRIAFGTPERRAQIAVVGQTWPVLANPYARDQIALDSSRIPPAPF